MEEQVRKLIPDLDSLTDPGGEQDMKSRVAAVAAKQETGTDASPEEAAPTDGKKPCQRQPENAIFCRDEM